MSEILINNDELENMYKRKQEKILCKMAYNGIDIESWIEGRAALIQKSRQIKSTFLDINSLVKSGRDLQADLEESGMQMVPREFVKLENMEY